MHVFSTASARRGLGALLGAIGLQGALGCNTITGVDALRFDPCAPSYSSMTVTEEIGSDGGSAFHDACPEGEVLVGLQGGVNGPILSGISGICGAVRISETSPVEITVTAGEAMPTVRGVMSSEEPESRRCPPNEMVVGFSGSTTLYDPNAPRPILWRVALVCAPLVVEGPHEAASISLGETTSTPSLGGAEDAGDAFDPVPCPENQVARAIQGRSGLLVDALGLGCAELSLACPWARSGSEE
ncbi:hypothetical protein [Polyangium fumosum]|uniref:Uncharacterized protein n=1 Tax=Polyangium fumosum TaxID=889272 RepID=A0A4U1I972_9BACT|nr:hypothetical protein [Polyangium fumosum]TKC90026.1 hypothetical protein E8A74_51185 [Polyangium fumosum]